MRALNVSLLKYLNACFGSVKLGMRVCCRGKMCIMKQIEERQEENMLQDELKEQSKQQLLESLERMQVEELEVWDQKPKSF